MTVNLGKSYARGERWGGEPEQKEREREKKREREERREREHCPQRAAKNSSNWIFR